VPHGEFGSEDAVDDGYGKVVLIPACRHDGIGGVANFYAIGLASAGYGLRASVAGMVSMTR
jgi:hypothetical protein